MPLPDDVATFTLVAEFPPLSPDGTERQGQFTFTPIPSILPSKDAIYLGVENATLNATGGLAKTLIANDAFAEDFAWRVDGAIDGLTPFSVTISVPASAGTVNLGAIAEFETLPPDYLVIPGPQGPEGPPGSGEGGGGAPSGPAGGDLTGTYPNPGVTKVNGVAVTGTPSAGQVPTASSSTAASWQTPTSAPSAASTVASGTSFGVTSSAGAATTYSRGDHSHGTPAAPTKTTVGLGNVDNTSDAAKPVSTATATALAAKADLSGGTVPLAQLPTPSAQGALTKASNLSDLTNAGTARTNLGLGTAATSAATAFDAAGAAATAQTGAATYTDGKIAAEVTRANTAYDTAGAAATVAGNLSSHSAASTTVHGIADTSALVTTADSRLTNSRTPSGAAGGDLSGTYPNPSVAKVAGVAVSGTAASGKVLTASSGTAASWQDPAGGGGGGGGSSIVTASVRITDDDLSGLPMAASWTVVVTKPGTPLQASIPAVAGDRIRVCGNFMHAGAHFHDWVLLDSAGAIAEYAATGTSTPGTEGNPVMYPSLSFSYLTADDMFTVASGHIDGSGNATVALAHMGTAAGLVYAHPTYPWRLRLENIGPEPA